MRPARIQPRVTVVSYVVAAAILAGCAHRDATAPEEPGGVVPLAIRTQFEGNEQARAAGNISMVRAAALSVTDGGDEVVDQDSAQVSASEKAFRLSLTVPAGGTYRILVDAIQQDVPAEPPVVLAGEVTVDTSLQADEVVVNMTTFSVSSDSVIVVKPPESPCTTFRLAWPELPGAHHYRVDLAYTQHVSRTLQTRAGELDVPFDEVDPAIGLGVTVTPETADSLSGSAAALVFTSPDYPPGFDCWDSGFDAPPAEQGIADDFGTPGEVWALGTYGGQLVAAGIFCNAGGTPVQSIASWNGSSWVPLGGGFWGFGTNGCESGGWPQAMIEYEGRLVVTGYFIGAGSTPANSIAQWDGASWTPLGEGLRSVAGGSTPVGMSLAIYNGSLFVAGHFDSAGSIAVRDIARWDGVSWADVGGGVTSAWIGAMAPFQGELIVAGESGLALNGAPVRGAAAWDGQGWRPLESGPPSMGSIRALTVVQGYLIAGGSLLGRVEHNVVRWDGVSWEPMGQLGDFNEVESLAVHNGRLFGGVYAPGATGIGGVFVWEQGQWQALGGDTDGTTYALLSVDGHLYAGGDFTMMGGRTSAGIAGWTE
jgi:hypothetical protein